MNPTDANALERPWTAGELARTVSAELLGDASVRVTRIDVFDRAGPASITFIRSDAVARRWKSSTAGCALVSRLVAEIAGEINGAPRALLVVPDADDALITLLRAFTPPSPAPQPGIHATSIIEHGASVAPSASIGPFCVVQSGAVVGERTQLQSHVFVGANARVGEDCTLHPGVRVLERCVVGDCCILHAGVVLGADGFGYRPAPDKKSLVKVPHIGVVRLGAHVEIGANSCVDRAKFGATTIGEGTKIDNLCQIGHNCTIGKCCLICGGCGLAGSVTLEDGVVLAGGVGVADNITIGAGARVGGHSAVSGHLPAGGDYLGYPASDAAQTKRSWIRVRRLGEHHREAPEP